MVLSFFDEFDTSHISKSDELNLLSVSTYENAISIILNNKNNHNFKIEKGSFDGKSFVYKDDEEKYIRIDNIEIYRILWKKTYSYLINILTIGMSRGCYMNHCLLSVASTIILEQYQLYKKNDDASNHKIQKKINKVLNHDLFGGDDEMSEDEDDIQNEIMKEEFEKKINVMLSKNDWRYKKYRY
jgi:hypothetical protein